MEKAVQTNPENESVKELVLVRKYMEFREQAKDLKKKIKTAEAELDDLAYRKYPEMNEDDVKSLVIDDKWMASLEATISGEMDRVSQRLTARLSELADRYDAPLGDLESRVKEMEGKVNAHLEKMGFSWTT